MLDHFSIVTQGGIVLCSKSFTPSPSPVDSLIRSAIIEERSNSTSTNSNNSISKWEKDSYSILWTLANEFDIIFILAFQRILRLSYVEELLLEVKRVFLNEFGDNVMLLVQRCQGKPLESFTVEQREILESRIMNLFSGWAETFAKLLKHFEEIDMKVSRHSI